MLGKLCLFLIVGCAVSCDIKTRRIPNRLCVYGICSGFLMAVLGIGETTLLQSIIGIVLPVVILFALYALRILGAGDIKLFSVIGAFTGFSVWKIICLSMIFGAFAGAVMVIRRVVRYIRADGDRLAPVLAGGLTKICFSVPIALGLIVYILEEVISGGVQAWNM